MSASSVRGEISPPAADRPVGHRLADLVDSPFAPYCMLLAMLVLTGIGWRMSARLVEATAAEQFEREVDDAERAVLRRIRSLVQLLRGAQAYLGAGAPKREEWRRFAELQQLEHSYPGVVGLAFAEWVPAAGKADLEQRMRAGGHPMFQVFPPGDRDGYAAVVLIEALAPANLPVIGFDLWSNQGLRPALQRARDTGAAALTGTAPPVVAAGAAEPGALMCIPVYRGDQALAHTSDRRATLAGFAFCAFRVGDLVREVLGTVSAHIACELFDGDQPSPGTRLFAVDDGPAAHEPDHRADRRLQIAGRTWTLRCRSRPGFETRTASIQPWIVALGGLAVSGLLFAVQLSLVGRRKVALARAEQMTAASRAAHERFDLAVRGSNTGIWDWDIPNGVVWFSPRWKAIVGHADDEIRHAYGEWESRLHPDDMPRTLAALEAYLGGRTPDYEVEFRMRHKDGTYRWILARGIALRDASGKPYRMAGSHLDITQQKQQWAELQASLAEKETLLREVHHRVKNNMQVISSLLRLQAQTFEGGRSHDLFADCQDRIHTMALVHEKLYRSGNLAAIDFGDYARDLASILRQAHGLDAGQVQIGVQADTVLLNIDTSVPLGLVLCELVTNALKHAFPEGRRGTIEIAIRGEPDGGCCLCVTDDGVGMPEHLAAGQGTSLGLRLVHMLVRQIDATFEHRKSPTTFTIRFAGRRTVAG